jgi:hypothetical protein
MCIEYHVSGISYASRKETIMAKNGEGDSPRVLVDNAGWATKRIAL